MDLLWQTAVNATYAASYMALIAVGLVMIFGVMGVINFAHGELYMVGAYCVVFLYAHENFPFLLAVAAGLDLRRHRRPRHGTGDVPPACATTRWAASSPPSASC